MSEDPKSLIIAGVGNGICDTCGRRRETVIHFRMAAVERTASGYGLTGVTHAFKLCETCTQSVIQTMQSAWELAR